MWDKTIGISFLVLTWSFHSGDCQETTTVPATTTTTAAPRIQCYSCGLEEIDPEHDAPGSYCDLDKSDNCADGKKMYNHTCDIMDRLGTSGFWVRTCPEGVQSCFYATGKYEGQTPVFRGCADAKYPHDEKCDRVLQAVTVVEGKKSEDVEVLLCYCNEDNCNTVLSGAAVLKSVLGLLILPVILLITLE